ALVHKPKRQAKPAADEGFWDCSVCTFRNSAEAFKCSICDVRKGTSTSSDWGEHFSLTFGETIFVLLEILLCILEDKGSEEK
uniref:RanBP2-type domain-containing protein n=1 Tax=Gopherus agassizii TaxID=38772 RepID=A0A452GUT1_9SAUR